MKPLNDNSQRLGYLVAVATALAAPKALAIDLSVALLPLTYECVEVRSVGLEETSMGQMRFWDGKSNDTAYRYEIHAFNQLKEQAVTNPAKKFGASFFSLREAWEWCRQSKANLGLKGGQMEFCLSIYIKIENTPNFFYTNTNYCQTGGNSLPNLGGWTNDYSTLVCQNTLRIDTDKLFVLKVRNFFQNAMGVTHEKCMRLDK